MKDTMWSLGNGTCALYTENAETAKAAREMKLRQMTVYSHFDGKAFAWQFAGPEEAVKEVLRREAEKVRVAQVREMVRS